MPGAFILLLAGLAAQSAPIAATYRALQEFRMDQEGVTVPEAGRAKLTMLKHQLRDRALERLNEESVDVVRDTIDKEFVAFRQGHYGRIESVRLERPSDHRDLLILLSTIGVAGSSDTSLYLFARQTRTWRSLVELESNGYESTLGAQYRAQYSISPPDSNGSYLLVFAHYGYWNGSAWRTLRYAVIRGNRERAAVSATGQHGIHSAMHDPAFRLAADAGGFVLTFYWWHDLEAGVTRAYVLRYKLETTGLKRVGPLALLPGDFIDEWLKLSWNEATRWSQGDLGGWHSRLRDLKGHEFESVEVCGGNRWQIAYPLDGEKRRPLVYFHVAREHGDFLMTGVSLTVPDPCREETLWRIDSLPDPATLLEIQ